MKKSYYYLFGTSIDDIRSLSDILYRKFDLEFKIHESDYIGEYMKYSGLYADKISIEKNFNKIDNSWKEKEFKVYPTLIYVSNFLGKNAEKLAKGQYLKKSFEKIEDIKLLKEDIIESKD